MSQGLATEDERFDLLLLRDAVEYQRWMLSRCAPGLSGDVLEVGAGIGNITRWLAQRADHVVALEPEEAMSREVAALHLANVDVSSESLESFARTTQERFDHVVMINVLEHIEDDQLALRLANELLRPGGRLAVLVPAHPTLFGSLDERYGHLRRYGREELETKIASGGFEPQGVAYFNPIGALGWFLVARLARRPRLGKGSVWISERVVVPVGQQLERLGRPPPFGQSVVARGVKPPKATEHARP